MAGIYIHIPFCRHKCPYCNFYSVTSFKNKEVLLSAILHELNDSRHTVLSERIDTVYLGGGTPSILHPGELEKLLDTVYTCYDVSEMAEITLEANPDDLDYDRLKALQHLPVNRLSIGIQSFHVDDLKYLNRIHSATKAHQSIQDAQEAGFNNISIDLIYGIPGLTDKKWLENLQFFLKYKIPHLSAYALTVEEKTPLYKFIKENKLVSPDENQSIEQFLTLREILSQNGFLHYEISNFALPGFQSKHNQSYWKGTKYIGIGPSAHSYNGLQRQWNISAIVPYAKKVIAGETYFESEELTLIQKFNEYVMTSLRTADGLDTRHVASAFGISYLEGLEKGLDPYLHSGHLQKKNHIITLTGQGMLFADKIASDLFI